MSQINIFAGINGGTKSVSRPKTGIRIVQTYISENFSSLDPDVAIELLKAGDLSDSVVGGFVGKTIKDIPDESTDSGTTKSVELTEEDYEELDKDLSYWHK